MSECFKRWREANKVAKIEDAMSNQEKASLLKMLEGLLKNGRIAKVREVIEKFKQNRKITDIQRNFLKRLLMSPKQDLSLLLLEKCNLSQREKTAIFMQRQTDSRKGLNNFAN